MCSRCSASAWSATCPSASCEHLPGYRGMGPVRVGNQAHEHFQHDVYGNIVLAAAQAFHDQRLLHPAGLRRVRAARGRGEQAVALHDQPDAGMWELRTRARVHTSSALMCWAACDRLAKIAQRWACRSAPRSGNDRASHHARAHPAASLERGAPGLRRELRRRDLDASVLLMAEVGLIDPMDPRFVATLRALETHLCDGPYMRRYEAADDFGKPETAFNICTFWRIDALARIGRKGGSPRGLRGHAGRRNPLGLLSEDTHATTGEMWGNFPQTYSMVGIINAAVRLSAPWDSVI
jgi:GH15 family glucan-1,4-alpha-glucosidase